MIISAIKLDKLSCKIGKVHFNLSQQKVVRLSELNFIYRHWFELFALFCKQSSSLKYFFVPSWLEAHQQEAMSRNESLSHTHTHTH